MAVNLAGIEKGFAATPDGRCAEAEHGMVAAAFPEASRAGAAMLARGGNAVDAAAAAALCLSVCEPQASGLGGQTAALIHLDGRAFFLDGSGRVPAAARLEDLGPGEERYGYRATSVPTTVAVLGYMVRRYGRLTWREVAAPALCVASRGYRITPLQHRLQQRELPHFAGVASGSGARYFLKGPGEPYAAGDLFRQPELAGLMAKLADEGPESFYRGETAGRIDGDMRAHGGFLRADDLDPVPWPVERPAIAAAYRNMDLISGPPPSAGRSLFTLLHILEEHPGAYLAAGGPRAAWDIARAVRRVLTERRTHPVAPEAYDASRDRFPFTGLFEGTAGSRGGPGDTGGETTHVSAMDRWGNAVGITQSVNLVYGAKAAADGLGFLYNDYLLDCDTTDPGHPHFLRPGKTPASFVVPLMALIDGSPWLVTGSPGSERIVSAVAQFLIHVADGGLAVDAATRKPRLHYSPEGILSLEAGRFAPDVVDRLERKAERFSRLRDHSFHLGAVHSVLRCRTRKGFQGAADIRRDGASTGC